MLAYIIAITFCLIIIYIIIETFLICIKGKMLVDYIFDFLERNQKNE